MTRRARAYHRMKWNLRWLFHRWVLGDKNAMTWRELQEKNQALFSGHGVINRAVDVGSLAYKRRGK